MGNSVDAGEVGAVEHSVPLDDLGRLDAILAASAFGSDAYLTDQMHFCFKRRLEKIAARLPAAGALLDALSRADATVQYRVLGDMTVRCAVQHALTRLESDLDYGLPLTASAAIFDAARAQVDAGVANRSGFGLSDLTRRHPSYTWICEAQRPDGTFDKVFHRAYDFLIEDTYGKDARPCSVDADELAIFRKGIRLLGELLPLSSRNALSHVHLVSFMSPVGDWAGRMSASEYRLSGTIFLNRYVLAHHWRAAEHILHEALHQQLYDFRQAHSLFKVDDGWEYLPTVLTPWNGPGNNQFDAFRAIAAFHVYTYLSLLSALAQRRAQELRGEYGEQSSQARMIAPHTALSRARHLRDQIKVSLAGELGLAGQRLVQWCSSALDFLDSSPPPRGSTLHLYLDRYRVEARQVLLILNGDEDHSSLYEPLGILAEEEIRTAYGVLEMLGAEDERAQLDCALSGVFKKHDKQMEFGRIRGLISKTFLTISDGYRLSTNMKPDNIIANMVDTSSDRLNALIGSS